MVFPLIPTDHLGTEAVHLAAIRVDVETHPKLEGVDVGPRRDLVEHELLGERALWAARRPHRARGARWSRHEPRSVETQT